MNLTQINEQIYGLERKLRLGRNVESGLEIVHLLESIVPDIALKEPSIQREYQSILEQILQNQQKGDWLAVADYLAYELIHFLKQRFD